MMAQRKSTKQMVKALGGIRIFVFRMRQVRWPKQLLNRQQYKQGKKGKTLTQRGPQKGNRHYIVGNWDARSDYNV